MISDSDRKLDALMDVIKDACMKMDEGGKRLDARMDAMEEQLKDRKDSAKKDEEEKKEEPKADAEDEEEKKEEPKADKRKDSAKKDEDGEVEEEGKPKEVAADKRKDAAKKDSRKDADEEEKKEEAHADSNYMTRAEAMALQAQIKSLQARAPAIISDSERERFAAIQEQADPVFQAFNDRAPAPMDGETPTMYQRRLASKMQGHSAKWKDSRLGAVSDAAMLDTVVADIYADALTAARRGVDIPAGRLRENRVTSPAGHTIVTFDGETDAWTKPFTGRVNRSRAA